MFIVGGEILRMVTGAVVSYELQPLLVLGPWNVNFSLQLQD